MTDSSFQGFLFISGMLNCFNALPGVVLSLYIKKMFLFELDRVIFISPLSSSTWGSLFPGAVKNK